MARLKVAEEVEETRPLDDEERLSWEEHKIIFQQFARSSMSVVIALADVKKRELYREEYGPGEKGYQNFLRNAPYFNLSSLNRQRRHQFKAAVGVYEELSTAVDASLLEGLNENQLRLLSSIKNPAHRLEVFNRLRSQDKEVTEDNVERAYTALRQEREEESRQRKQECLEVESEEEGEVCAPDIPSGVEINLEALEAAAAEDEKIPDYAARCAEYGRLFVKNGSKIEEWHLDDELRDDLAKEVAKVEKLLPKLKKLVGQKEMA